MDEQKQTITDEPNPIIEWDIAKLHRKSKLIATLDDGNKILSRLLFVVETFYKEKAAGLAAPQIGIFKRAFIIHAVTPEGVTPPPYQLNSEWQGFINPIIHETEGEGEIDYDGCLSFPGLVARTMRWRRIKISALNCPEPIWLEPGEDRTAEDGTSIVGPGPSIYFQHELDHLNGVLFFERSIDDEEKTELTQTVKEHFAAAL
jgi:peptide deformylase